MRPTSQDFKDAVYAPARTVAGRVTFDISDVTAVQDITNIETPPEEATISNKTQIADKIRDTTYNFATWEPDRFKLDGSFSFPDEVAENNGEMGFVSSELCLADGSFDPHITITFTFGENHSSAGVTVFFDVINNEYAMDFTVTAYDASNAVVETIDVTDNTEAVCTVMGQFAEYQRIELTIKKWCRGERRARVLEVNFGIIKVYTDDSLISMGLIEEMELTTGRLPSPEFSFTVDNVGREFNILNPIGFYKFLQEKQQVIAELGVDIGGAIEWVSLGEYLLHEWKSDEGSLTASFTARTTLDLMSEYDYEQLTPVNKTLYALADELFATCGITRYWIDPALNSVTTNSMSKKTNCKNILQMIAIAGCANVFVTRDNVLTLKCLSMGQSRDVIDLDNSYDEPKITLDPIVKQVNVTYWSDLNTSAIVSMGTSAAAGDVLKLEQNTLINTSARATEVANWILAMSNYRAEYKSNWRGNPAHELGDVIELETSYGDNMKAIITKNDIKYEGYLRAPQTLAKGAVN